LDQFIFDPVTWAAFRVLIIIIIIATKAKAPGNPAGALPGGTEPPPAKTLLSLSRG
jgi:hypothetical protein